MVLKCSTFSSVPVPVLVLTFIVVFAEGTLVNKEVHRTVDITTQLVMIHYNITLENNGQNMVRWFDFFVEPETRKSLAYLKANSLNSSDKSDLKITEIREDEFDDPVSYKINLKKPIGIGQFMRLQIMAVFTHQLFPYPVYIYQNENQLVIYNGNYYFYSPYLSKTQSTTVICSSDKFENFSILYPTSLFKNTITYGPYENIPPFTILKQTVHYINNEAFVTVTNMERTIEVSHWGNIAVEETIELKHSGAILKGPFSRFDYQKLSSGTSSMLAFTTVLPGSAKDVYYRDVLGNISSSETRILQDSVHLRLQLRFPLFGGWRISYTIGYNLPTYEYLYSNGEDFILQMRVLDHVYDDMVVDELITKIILPEFCTDIWLLTPFPMVRLPDYIHYSYLDTVGRPVTIFAKNNMVESHIRDFELQYVFQHKMMFMEPLLLILALFIFFVLIIVLNRIDFSIDKDDIYARQVKNASSPKKMSCKKMKKY